MESIQKNTQEHFDIKGNLTKTMLLNALHNQLSKTISIIHITTSAIFLKHCEAETVHLFNIIIDLSCDIQEIYRAVYKKELTVTAVNHARYYQINTNKPPLSLHFLLCEKVNQAHTFVGMVIDFLFSEQLNTQQLNLVLTIQDYLAQTHQLLEIAMLKYPEYNSECIG